LLFCVFSVFKQMCMNTRTLFSLLLLVTLAACQKEVTAPITTTTTTSPTTPPSGGTGGGTGGSGGGTGGGGTGGGTTVTDSSYMPLAVGNWWKVMDSASGSIRTQTATANMRWINGVNHRSMFVAPSTVPGTDSAYYEHDATVYHFAALIPTTGGGVTPISYLYLKDAPSGTSWTEVAGTVNGLTATITGSVLERDLTKVVAGRTYRQVIHSHMDLSYTLIGPTASYDFYSAKGVGIILTETTSLSGMGGTGTTRIVQGITDYSVH
jgi:hypothetical protein